MNTPHRPPSLEDVAIIGMSGRFPGAHNLGEFWNNLRNGVESVTFFSEKELSNAGLPSSILKNPDFVNAGGLLDDVELFDASFFSLTPREAETLDPQQRLLLECSWQALEDAGYDSQQYKGSVGVYAGGIMSSYLLNLLSNPEHRKLVGDFQVFTGNDKDHLTTRVSYKLNLTGPSVTVQTACSTSLVAVVMACQSLLNYQCDMALAGGIAIRVPQKAGYVYQEGMIFSRDGHCRPFDAEASGTLFSNGVGLVVLKRLADAVADGDCIHAVIKGAAINNDGSLKVGYTAPSLDAQAEVIAMAQEVAGINPETITYIEAHGTATPLGDPIEIAALTKAFRAHTDKKNFCAIGSVKSNVGHLDAAAGIAGLIKTVLALKHRQIPPSINFSRPNPVINFGDSPFYVSSRLSEWQTGVMPRRAGVSSFGIGGTNAHVVLEEAPPPERSESARSRHLLLLSARSKAALDTLTASYAVHLSQHSDSNLADLAYTSQIGRKAFNQRRILVSENLADAATALSVVDPGRVFTATKTPGEHAVAFLFPGQGAQHINMGLEVYRSESVFRKCVDDCCEVLHSFLGFDLRSILYPAVDMTQEATARLEQTEVAQPALFVIEYALAKLWMEWGVRPETMLGHSIGEYVAACLAGVFSPEEALQLVAERGRLMQRVLPGAMLAVPLPEREVERLLNPDLQIAAINLPSSCVVSGPVDAIEKFRSSIAPTGVECRRIHTSHAFHSRMMEPVLRPFAAAVAKMTPRPPQIPFVSNVTGTWITSRAATDPAYWAQHLRQPVLFSRGLECLLNAGNRTLLEVGPGQTVAGFALRHPARVRNCLVLSSLQRAGQQASDMERLLNSLGRLWLVGSDINWARFNGDERRNRVSLPTYPFERKRHWVDAQVKPEGIGHGSSQRSGKLDLADWFHVPCWKQTVVPDFRRKKFADEKSCWLVFEDHCGVGQMLSHRLQRSKQMVIRVSRGDRFAKLDENIFSINPRCKEHYDSLFRELRTQGRLPRYIAHVWSTTQNGSSADSADDHQALGFGSLMFLAQALGDHCFGDAINIGVISNHLHNVIGTEYLNPEKAALLGPCRVIPQEYRGVSCRSIDIVAGKSKDDLQSELIDILIAEIESSGSESVAYRGLRRWTRTFEAVKLEKAGQASPRLRKDGVYLITGGLGGIGLSIARYLAKTVSAKLVLLGRSTVPPRDEWVDAAKCKDQDNKLSETIRGLLEIEDLGGELMVRQADVVDPAQMTSVVKKTLERFGAIHGVIHAAGVSGGGMLQLKTAEMAAQVLAPKVSGMQALDMALKDVSLDFLVLCSSISSILGGVGQADYSGANSFLDAYAEKRACEKGDFVVSINWDAWLDVGMAAKIPKGRASSSRQFASARGIAREEGIEALARILSSSFSQVAVVTTDFATAIHDYESSLDRSGQKTFTESDPALSEVTPDGACTRLLPSDEVERRIADIWQKLLGTKQLGIYDNFFELGGDSLLGTQLLSLLRSVFHVQLPLQSLLEVPTVAGMAARIRALQ